jgi:hypothetical protein
LHFRLQQNNLFKTREEKYKSRISVLEALASGTKEESKVTKVVLSIYLVKIDGSIHNLLFIIWKFLS